MPTVIDNKIPPRTKTLNVFNSFHLLDKLSLNCKTGARMNLRRFLRAFPSFIANTFLGGIINLC